MLPYKNALAIICVFLRGRTICIRNNSIHIYTVSTIISLRLLQPSADPDYHLKVQYELSCQP